MVVHITDQLYQELVTYSLSTYPLEACGFITGKPGPIPGQLLALAFLPVPNMAQEPRQRFEMSPESIISAFMKQADVIGLFHSHPSAPPIPSASDLLSDWHTLPTYWILSAAPDQQPDLQLYQIKKAPTTSYHKLAFVIGQ